MESYRETTNVKSYGIKGLSLIAFVVAASLGGCFWKSGSSQRDLSEITSYTVAAESGTLPGLVTTSGELQAVRSVNVSPERQGLLEEVYVEEGDKVKQGQLIAKMDGGDFVYRLNELKADFNRDKSAFDRRNSLFSKGAISAEQHDEYLNRFLSSKARLKQREVEGKELMIRAPFSGLITNRYSEPGAFVAPTTRASSVAGSTSSSIVELSQGLEIVAKVPESDIGRIQVGQEATVRVEAFPDLRFKSKVSEIASRASAIDNVTSFEVTLLLLRPQKKLRIGMTADVEFQTGQTAISTLVPTVAIVTENGKPGVLVVGKNNDPIFQKVELGISNGNKTAIIKGVKTGDLIFIDLPPWAKKKRD